MAIRWNIRDRATRQSIIVPGPTNHEERQTLEIILKNCASMNNLRHGEGRHLHNNLGNAAAV